MRFLDASRLEQLTGHPVRSEYKRPEDPDVLPPPDALVVAPATFNTINKWAAGISDTLALGLLNEAIGLAVPVVAVPTANIALIRHPAFARSVAELRASGVRVLFDPGRYPLPTPNMGAPGAALFPWDALFDELTRAASSLFDPGRYRDVTGLQDRVPEPQPRMSLHTKTTGSPAWRIRGLNRALSTICVLGYDRVRGGAYAPGYERACRQSDRTAAPDSRGADGDPDPPRPGPAGGFLGHHSLGRDRERV